MLPEIGNGSRFYTEMWGRNRPVLLANAMMPDPGFLAHVRRAHPAAGAAPTYLSLELIAYASEQDGFTSWIEGIQQEINRVVFRHGPSAGDRYPIEWGHLSIPILTLTQCPQDEPADQVLEADVARVIEDVLLQTPRFSIAFRGLIGTPNALLLCGQPDDLYVDAQDRLYQALQDEGLVDRLGLDQELSTLESGYRAAPMLVMRFTGNIADPASYVAAIEQTRGRDLGSLAIEKVTLLRRGPYHGVVDRPDPHLHVLAEYKDAIGVYQRSLGK